MNGGQPVLDGWTMTRKLSVLVFWFPEPHTPPMTTSLPLVYQILLTFFSCDVHRPWPSDLYHSHNAPLVFFCLVGDFFTCCHVRISTYRWKIPLSAYRVVGFINIALDTHTPRHSGGELLFIQASTGPT